MTDTYCPEKHHIDRRAADLIAQVDGDDEELFTTRQVAALFKISHAWVTQGRHRGYGPPFIKTGTRSVRYRRSDIKAWLDQRVRASTAEYASHSAGGRPKGSAAK